MTYFDAVDLAEFSALVVDASPDVIVITRQSGTSPDGHGGTIDNWSTIATVAGKVMQRDSQPGESVQGQQLQGDIMVEITVPTGTDIENNDRCTVGSQVYEVVGVAPHRSFEVRRRITARAFS